ncbi:MAG TPA: 16S rRNA (cytosine(1402)-N(4))-methyltransferase RsmH [Gemmatimonadaceae bacterium]|nr:16S rRNA (cytosine(1402)-N(4))-methyltransferase RsmH [Gemmatimonadaceae bacterium]
MNEVVTALGGDQGGSTPKTVLDCTLGGGGHTLALLEHGMDVTGVDRDPEAIAAARDRGAVYIAAGRLQTVQGDFTRIDEIGALEGRQFDGILADLGISSHQIDTDARGFSFRQGVPLDMRMAGTERGSGQGDSAADFLNSAPEEDLSRAFWEYGDEPKGRRLAREVVRRRETRPFVISDDLVGAIRGALGAKTGPADFARLFQAIRIAVNDELDGLARALPLLRDRLTAGGILAIIAYHSGEDRLVKQAMRDWSIACHCPPKQPMCTCEGIALGKLLTRKAVKPAVTEATQNPRARSAKLRVWQKAA